jgi:nucleoside 2-deoxyribosyltransferase
MANKPQHRRLRCFVASAFGYDDVDRVYTRLIKPTLGSLRVAFSRVDRVDHNDDIDNKIMELLEEADFCIADLTYARPSVYYEAGYAMARKPVIFIARKDHFKARDNDPAGNLRVHFDLQMKNIIPWGISDAAFKSNLQKRVNLVTRPLVQSLISDAGKSKEREAFGALSQQQRIETLEQVSEQATRSHSFSLEGPEYRRWRNAFGLGSAIDAERKLGGIHITLRVYIEPHFQLKGLRDVGYRKTVQPLKKADTPKPNRRKNIVVNIFASLGKISQNNLERAFPHHAKNPHNDFREAIRDDRESHSLVRSLVMPIDQIVSPNDFLARINDALNFACSNAVRKF